MEEPPVLARVDTDPRPVGRNQGDPLKPTMPMNAKTRKPAPATNRDFLTCLNPLGNPHSTAAPPGRQMGKIFIANGLIKTASKHQKFASDCAAKQGVH